MRGLSLQGPALPSENHSAQGDHMHSCSQGFGLGPKSPLSQSLHANHSGGEGKNIFVIGTPGLSQSLHANHSGGELPLGRMDWNRTDFWLAVGTGKNRSSTTTSPCTPYSLPSELQGDRVGKKIIFYRIFISVCAQASATASPTACWRRRASLRRGYAKSIT